MNTCNAFLVLQDVNAFIHFTQQCFNARLLKIKKLSDNTITYAEVAIKESVLVASKPREKEDYFPASLYVYVADCDESFNKAIALDACVIMQPITKPDDGERYGAVQDSNGNVWWISQKQ